MALERKKVALTQRLGVHAEEARSCPGGHSAVPPRSVMPSPHADSLQARAGPPEAALLFSAELSSFQLT